MNENTLAQNLHSRKPADANPKQKNLVLLTRKTHPLNAKKDFWFAEKRRQCKNVEGLSENVFVKLMENRYKVMSKREC